MRDDIDTDRFHIHQVLQDLSAIVRKRLNIADTHVDCMLFPSETTAQRFVSQLRAKDAKQTVVPVTFYLPDGVSTEHARWGRFVAVIYDRDLHPQARKTWCILGDGMSSRHGEFCKDRINFMHSSSSNSAFQTAAPYSNTTELAPAPWTDSARHEKQEIKKQIAELVMSEKPGSKIVSPDDVFLYSKGMVAINYVARALLKTLPGPEYNGAVVYGLVRHLLEDDDYANVGDIKMALRRDTQGRGDGRVRTIYVIWTRDGAGIG